MFTCHYEKTQFRVIFRKWLTSYGLFVQKSKCKTYPEMITKCRTIFIAHIWALHKTFMIVIDEVGMWRSKEKMQTKRPLHFCKILVYGQRLVMVTHKFFFLINLKIPWLYFGVIFLSNNIPKWLHMKFPQTYRRVFPRVLPPKPSL